MAFSSRITWVSQHQKRRTILDLLEQEKVSGGGITWAICKSAPRLRQITMPTPTTQFLQAGCPSCRPTNSVKALKAIMKTKPTKINTLISSTSL